MIPVTVLIVSYNVRERLRRCLSALAAAAEVIVVDNASTDGSAAMVAAEFKAVQLIAWSVNRGFSAGVNAAARRATQSTLLVLNPDTELLPPQLGDMMTALARHPEAVALGFRQVDGEGRFQLSFGPSPSLVLRSTSPRISTNSPRASEKSGRSAEKPTIRRTTTRCPTSCRRSTCDLLPARY